jgi:hypothetical protein
MIVAMKRIAFVIVTIVLTALCAHAQAPAQQEGVPEGPGLEFVCELRVNCEGTYTVGQTSHGNRVVIPIVGGTFEGPRMKGTILSGGADYQLVDQEHGRTEVEAIYSIKTDDDVYIHIRNCGIIHTGNGPDGKPEFYFRTTPKFEAPQDSAYDWLNNAVFVCMPGFATDCICLRIWKVL